MKFYGLIIFGEGIRILVPTLATLFPILSLQRSWMEVIHKKVLVVGDGGCGKTSLLIMLSTNHFPEDCPPTAFNTYVTNIVVDNREVEYTFVDTGGEIFGRLAGLCVHVFNETGVGQ